MSPNISCEILSAVAFSVLACCLVSGFPLRLGRIQVMFTPTICKVRCSQGRCVNYCDRGNMTTLYSSIVCPLLCKNGGICLHKDRCLCPPNFTGKFCQISIAPTTSAAAPAAASPSSTNEILKPVPLSAMAANQELTQSEFLLPLGQNQEAVSPSMVKVRVQHPPEASVKIHQVVKVSGFSPTLRTLSSSSSSGSAGAPAPGGGRVQGQTVRGGGTYTEHSGFKYCFREVKDGQCSSPLPGLRSREMCCRGIGKGWGITDCVLCSDNTGTRVCPAGFERVNGTHCVDVNECLLPGLCENGLCVNTRGSFSCVCRLGFILDASHGICISQTVISEEKGQCYRILGSGQGPSSCSLPILKNITKQICCCSRVGKAWGHECQKCPYFGSVAFKEICPAGPGYQYSSSVLQFNQRVAEQLGGRGAQLIRPSNQDNQGQSSRSESDPPDPSFTTQSRSHPPSTGAQGNIHFIRKPTVLYPYYNLYCSVHVHVRACVAVPGVCDSRPGVCGHGHCVDQQGGKHTCVCDQGYQPNSQRTYCQDVNECVQSPAVCLVGECVNTIGSYRCVCPSGYRSNSQQTGCEGDGLVHLKQLKSAHPVLSTDVDECQLNPCTNGQCENTLGSYRCVCRHGYRLTGNTCTDVNECEDPLRCPGQECVNSQGSYSCVSCQPGYRLLKGLCTDIDECRQALCSNGRCENTPGSFRCVCHHGYKLQNNTCADIDECAEPYQCPGQMCMNSVGSYRCVSCQPGYTLTNRQCTGITHTHTRTHAHTHTHTHTALPSLCPLSSDVNECEDSGMCPGQQRVCVNTVGSFRCDCPLGYRSSGLGRQCRDINECLEGDFCFSRGECVNTPGSYTCVCSQGFTLSSNRTACVDVDECVKPGVCLDGRCVNTEGSFQCLCHIGFTTNPEKTACLDVDECVSSGGSVCGSQRCENTIGSYHCLTSCEPGYQVSQSGECVDVNECMNNTVCGDHAFCQNLVGTYLCVCDQGFTTTTDGKACVDEDECVTLPGVCGSAHCENVEGSFMCECDTLEEFDAMTRQCFDPMLPPLPAARPGELRECYYNLAERGTCNLLATNTSQQECCCTVGEAWGLGCQYHTCPPSDTAEFLSLCPSGRGYVTTGPGAFSYRDVDECKRFHPEVCKSGVCVNNIPGYNCYCSSGYVYNSTLLECVDHDECEEESCVGGVCVNTVGSYYCSCQPPLVLDDTQRNCVNSSHLTVGKTPAFILLLLRSLAEITFMDCCCVYGDGWGMECALCPSTDSGDYSPPDGSPPRTFRLPPDPRAERAFGVRPPPPSQPDGPPLSLAPLPGSLYEENEEDEETWRPGPPFPPFTDRSVGGGGGAQRRVYERESTWRSTEDCGILHGCENGMCIRVAEGYTCDCYQGYELDMTSMTCTDINECEDGVNLEFPCVNARCVNTEGSFRCVCRRGYVMSRRPNQCVAA
uniref:Latent-transforming growth factor beta-binding protein 4 n=1 Tax=Mastacembelus armatus TaxID=205130 RepID=A0A3Q3N141_9TELE